MADVEVNWFVSNKVESKRLESGAKPITDSCAPRFGRIHAEAAASACAWSSSFRCSRFTNTSNSNDKRIDDERIYDKHFHDPSFLDRRVNIAAILTPDHHLLILRHIDQDLDRQHVGRR